MTYPNLKAIPRLKPITPLELYLQQVEGMFQNIQVTSFGDTYVMNQFGGILGQNYVLQNDLVIEVTDFDTSPETSLQGDM